eukprot:m.122138 g.122138  ORF g.122138 m.122138 type:complete len:813 (-) comp13719_c1_seq3:2957-5395(-)
MGVKMGRWQMAAIAIAALAAGVLMAYACNVLFQAENDWAYRSSRQKRLKLYSEQAFYFSYAEAVAAKSTSVWQALVSLAKDTSSEYPETVNAYARFNILPEVFVGLMQRSGWFPFHDSLDLLLHFLIALHGLQWTGFVLLAGWTVGLSTFPFVFGVCIMLFNYATRITRSPELRENWGMPFVWIQAWCTLLVLANSGQTHVEASVAKYIKGPGTWKGWLSLPKVGLICTTSFLLAAWQFAPFILFLQTVAAVFSYLIGLSSQRMTADLFSTQLVSAAIGLVILGGNTMLFSSLWVLAMVSTLIIFWLDMATTQVDAQGTVTSNGTIIASLEDRIVHCGLASVLTICVKVALSLLVTDDSHIFDLVKAQLFGYEDLMTGLYLCGPTYNPLEARDFEKFEEHSLLSLVSISLTLLAVIVALRLWISDREYFATITGRNGSVTTSIFLDAVGDDGYNTLQSTTAEESSVRRRQKPARSGGQAHVLGSEQHVGGNDSQDAHMEQGSTALIGAPRVAKQQAKQATLLNAKSLLSRGIDATNPTFSVSSSNDQAESAKLTTIFYLGLLSILGASIRRLCILLIPSMAILAAFALSPFPWLSILEKVSKLTYTTFSLRNWRFGITLSCFVGVCFMTYPIATSVDVKNFADDVMYHVPEPINPNMMNTDLKTNQLMAFLKKNTKATSVIAGDPVISSTIKLITGRPIVIHPHVENTAMRIRHDQLFQLFNRVSPKEVHSILRQFGAEFVVIAEGPCNLRCQNGKSMEYYANLGNKRSLYAHYNPQLDQFCVWARSLPVGQSTAYFKSVYHDRPFQVLKVL